MAEAEGQGITVPGGAGPRIWRDARRALWKHGGMGLTGVTNRGGTWRAAVQTVVIVPAGKCSGGPDVISYGAIYYASGGATAESLRPAVVEADQRVNESGWTGELVPSG